MFSAFLAWCGGLTGRLSTPGWIKVPAKNCSCSAVTWLLLFSGHTHQENSPEHIQYRNPAQFLPGFVLTLFSVNEVIQSCVVGPYLAGLSDVHEEAAAVSGNREWALSPSGGEY